MGWIGTTHLPSRVERFWKPSLFPLSMFCCRTPIPKFHVLRLFFNLSQASENFECYSKTKKIKILSLWHIFRFFGKLKKNNIKNRIFFLVMFLWCTLQGRFLQIFEENKEFFRSFLENENFAAWVTCVRAAKAADLFKLN